MPPLNTSITEDTSAEICLIANSFYKLFDSINAKIEVYSVGKLSDLLAENLENYFVNGVHQNVSNKLMIK